MAAARIRDAASRHLWNEEYGRFNRMLFKDENGSWKADATCDASLWGLGAYGLYSADDLKIEKTMSALKEALWVKTGVGGMARYVGDKYHSISDCPPSCEIPGNPWFVCTLWLADYYIERAKRIDELQEAVKIIEWVAEHALPSGVLAEQVHPFTGEPLSVSPLTWSHAAYVATVQKLAREKSKMLTCEKCGLSLLEAARKEDWVQKLFGETCNTIHGLCEVN